MTYPSFTYQSNQRYAMYKAPNMVKSILKPFLSVVSIPLSSPPAVAFFANSLFFPNAKIVPGKRVSGLAVSLSPAKFGRFFDCGSVVGKFLSRKNFLNWKPSFDPADNGTAGDFQFYNPFGKSFFNPVVNEKSAISFIIGLFLLRCPAAIFRGVRTVIINPIKACSFGWIAHVGKKVFKGLPLFANFYTSCAVIFKRLVGGVVASSFHMIPDGISFCGRGSVGSFHVFNLSRSKGFS